MGVVVGDVSLSLKLLPLQMSMNDDVEDSLELLTTRGSTFLGRGGGRGGGATTITEPDSEVLNVSNIEGDTPDDA